MKGLKKKWRAGLVWLLAYCAMVALYAWLHRYVYITTDSVFMVPLAEGVLAGNRRMNGWIFGTNTFFFTDFVPILLGRLLGFSYQSLVNLLPGTMLAAFVLPGLRLVLGPPPPKEQGRGRWLAYMVGGALFLGAVRYEVAYTILNLNHHNGLYPLVLLCFWLAARWRKNRKWSYLAAYTLVAFMAYFSDSSALFLVYAPLVVWAGRLLLQKKLELRRDIWLAAASLGSFAAARLFLWLLPRLHSFSTLGMPVSLSSPATWGERLYGLWGHLGIMMGYHAGQWQGSTGLVWLGNALGGLFLLAFVASLVWCLLHLAKLPDLELMLLAAALLNFALCVVTDIGIGYRYLVPTYLFGGLLAVRCWLRLADWLKARTKAAWPTLAVTGTLLLTSAVTVGTTFQEWKGQPPAGAEEQAVVRWLEQNHPGADGYGEFWASYTISHYSDWTISVYPVNLYGPGRLNLYHEIVNTGWYTHTGRHFIVVREGLGVDYDAMVALCGAPDEAAEFGRYTVYWWDKDIFVLLSEPE